VNVFKRVEQNLVLLAAANKGDIDGVASFVERARPDDVWGKS
jgi:hypothetical protein